MDIEENCQRKTRGKKSAQVLALIQKVKHRESSIW